MSRRRYVYRPDGNGGVEVVEVSSDWSDAPRSTGDLGKFQYDNLRATDGTDISSKTKHARYMREHGLALASDYTQSWEKAAKEREAIRSGVADREARREAVGRALYQVQQRRKRP